MLGRELGGRIGGPEMSSSSPYDGEPKRLLHWLCALEGVIQRYRNPAPAPGRADAAAGYQQRLYPRPVSGRCGDVDPMTQEANAPRSLHGTLRTILTAAMGMLGIGGGNVFTTHPEDEENKKHRLRNGRIDHSSDHLCGSGVRIKRLQLERGSALV